MQPVIINQELNILICLFCLLNPVLYQTIFIVLAYCRAYIPDFNALIKIG